jgi:hypothetical protein
LRQANFTAVHFLRSYFNKGEHADIISNIITASNEKHVTILAFDIWQELESEMQDEGVHNVASWLLKFFQLRQRRDQAPHKYVTGLETERNRINRAAHATGEKLGAELSKHDLARPTLQHEYLSI